jgi:hypothetical protein
MLQQLKIGGFLQQTSVYSPTTLRPEAKVTASSVKTYDSIVTEWDATGNLTRWRDLAKTPVDARTYTYDGAHRLLDARYYEGTGASFHLVKTFSHRYDGAGRITSFPGKGSYAYGDRESPYAVTQTLQDGKTYQYDVDGNMTHHGEGIQMASDVWGKPLFMTGGGRSKWMHWDADEQLASAFEFANGTMAARHYIDGWLEIRHGEGHVYNLRFGPEVIGQFVAGEAPAFTSQNP